MFKHKWYTWCNILWKSLWYQPQMLSKPEVSIGTRNVIVQNQCHLVIPLPIIPCSLSSGRQSRISESCSHPPDAVPLYIRSHPSAGLLSYILPPGFPFHHTLLQWWYRYQSHLSESWYHWIRSQIPGWNVPASLPWS